MVLDSSGAVYVTGMTDSTDFPTTPGAYDTSIPVQEDAFVAKISADGSTLVYATLLGGGDEDWGRAITVDGAGRAIVTGHTRSDDFPTTPGAYDRTHENTIYPDDGFVTIFEPDGSDLVYSTYFGGSAEEIGKGIAVDRTGKVYVGGATQSSNFPTTPAAYDPTYNPPSAGGGEMDAFVLKLDPSGNGAADLVFGTFIGSGYDEWVDAPGHRWRGCGLRCRHDLLAELPDDSRGLAHQLPRRAGRVRCQAEPPGFGSRLLDIHRRRWQRERRCCGDRRDRLRHGRRLYRLAAVPDDARRL